MLFKRKARRYGSVLLVTFLLFVAVFQIAVINSPSLIQDVAIFQHLPVRQFLASESKPIRKMDNKYIQSMEAVFSTRRKLVRDACLLDNRGNVQRLMIYKPANLSYCVVPKAGCTFWKRIFRFLNGDTGGKKISSPFDINRMIAHYGSYKRMGSLALSNLSDRNNIAKTNRLLIARDPYSRLWAVYLDKFFLPDFWRSHGQAIYKQRMNKHRNKNTGKKYKKICANDITFEEFIRYVVSTVTKSAGANEHWNPISRLCNPCQFNPDYVVTMETFSRDTNYILYKAGLSWVLKQQPKSHTDEELNMLIKYNFDLLGAKFYKGCMDGVDLSKRLWKVFQMNAFLSPKAAFPEVITFRPELATKVLFKAEVMKKVREYSAEKTTRREQKKEAMEAAYRKLPLSLVRMIPYIYENDFRLFGYESHPYGIYKNHEGYKNLNYLM